MQPTSQNLLPPVHADASVLDKLSQKQIEFCSYYAQCGNGSEAARVAGYHVQYADDLLRIANIPEAVAYFRTLYQTNYAYTAPKLLREWALQASFDISSLLNDDWSVKDLSDLPPPVREHLRHALQGIEVVEKQGSRTVKPRFNKQVALQEIGKLLGMYRTAEADSQGFTLSIALAASVAASESATISQAMGHIKVELGAKEEPERG